MRAKLALLPATVCRRHWLTRSVDFVTENEDIRSWVLFSIFCIKTSSNLLSHAIINDGTLVALLIGTRVCTKLQ